MKERPIGHYIVEEGGKRMVAWYSSGNFYKAGSAIPYNKNHFDAISEVPLDLDTKNTVKGTKW